jgi:hypothetical protein
MPKTSKTGFHQQHQIKIMCVRDAPSLFFNTILILRQASSNRHSLAAPILPFELEHITKSKSQRKKLFINGTGLDRLNCQ